MNAVLHHPPPAQPVDALARPLRDLRLSVIEACNFRCPYCMPADRVPDGHGLDAAGRLSFDEIETLVRGFVRDARRFQAVGFHRPSIVGMARAIGWLTMYVGFEFVHRRGAAMARYAAERLAGIDGVEVLTPIDRMAGLISFRIRGWEIEPALEELQSRTFSIARTVPLVNALRMSVGFWATEEELDRFTDGVRLLAAHTPETLPPRRTLTIVGQD